VFLPSSVDSWTEKHHTPGARVYPGTVQRVMLDVRLLREKSGAWGATGDGGRWGRRADGCQ